MNAQTPHFEVGGDSRVSSCMAFARRIFERPEIQKILAEANRIAPKEARDRIRGAAITEKEAAEWKRLYSEEKMSITAIARKVGRPTQNIRNHVLGRKDWQRKTPKK